jgi:adenylate kinase family enzyme
MTKQPTAYIFFGPAGCGKGTQAELLAEHIPFAHHIDSGAELRKYVENNITELALRMKAKMAEGLPIDPEDSKIFFSEQYRHTLENGTTTIFDGLIRDISQVEWLSRIFNEANAQIIIFHIHISLEEAISRISHRWYAGGTTESFSNQEEARAHSINGLSPFRRKDDSEEETVIHRYKIMYESNWAALLDGFQLATNARIIIIDGTKDVDTISGEILEYTLRPRS